MIRAVIGLVSGPRAKYAVLAFWVAVLVVAFPLQARLTGVEDNQAASWLPGSAESTRVLAAQARFQSPDTLPAVVIYERTAGITPADRQAAITDAATFGRIPQLDGQVQGPFGSRDGQALETIVNLDLGPNGWEKATGIVDGMRAELAAGAASRLATHVTGPAGNAADSGAAFSGIDTTLLMATVTVVVAILLLTYRSPVLWLLPVISAATALLSAEAVIYLLAAHAGLTVNAQSAGILTVLVFGAGTDYALLLIARYREELRRHRDRHEAMAVALHRAGPAIIASAGTVVLGMLCLLAAQMNSTKGLGPVAAIGVAVGLLAMLTLLPALLVTVGRWVFWPVRPQVGTAEPTATGLWARVGRRISRRPRLVWIATVVVLGAMAVGTTSLDATGLTTAESFRNTPDSVTGEEVAQRHFPAGTGSPVVIVSTAAAAGRVRGAATSTPGISSVAPPVVAGGTAYLQATSSDPPDSAAAYATIRQLRTAVHAVPGADALVGGYTAINLDVQEASSRDNLVVIPLVLLVVFLVLTALLRAVVAPLVLMATVVLSFGAALGVSALVFRHVFGFGGADSSLPLFVFVFLVALGIDYNIFLMTRVREEAPSAGTRRAAVVGLAATGGVITSAGLVLAGTFAVLATLPLTAFAEIGFAVAFGVLLDTIVVRSVLVTALSLDLGRWMWWPGALHLRRDDADPLSAAAQSEPVLVE